MTRFLRPRMTRTMLAAFGVVLAAVIALAVVLTVTSRRHDAVHTGNFAFPPPIAKVAAGDSEASVRRRLGAPTETRGRCWIYRHFNASTREYRICFSDRGTVSSKAPL